VAHAGETGILHHQRGVEYPPGWPSKYPPIILPYSGQERNVMVALWMPMKP
jgi:hypothetical protein